MHCELVVEVRDITSVIMDFGHLGSKETRLLDHWLIKWVEWLAVHSCKVIQILHDEWFRVLENGWL